MLIFDQLRKNDPPLRFLAFVVAVAMSVLLAGLWWVQIVSARDYQASLETQSFRTIRIPAVRGKILDRNGVVLADNRPAYNIGLYLEELSPAFRKEYREIRPMERITNAVPFWQAWLGVDEVKVKPVELSADESLALQQRARYNVANDVVQRIAAKLGRPLTLDWTNFHVHYQKRRFMPYPVVENADPALIVRFHEQGVGALGAELQLQSTRVYPYASTAAHLLGYLRPDNDSIEGEQASFGYRLPDYRGAVGIEGGYDKTLHGRAGVKSVLINSLGYRQDETIWVPAQPGSNAVLTIDLRVQQAAENALRQLGPYGANTRGAIVVMHVQSGDVLALVSSPTFDPNRFIQGWSSAEWRRMTDTNLIVQINRATQGSYPPGSIFKTVVGLAALEAGLNPLAQYYVQEDPTRPGFGHIYVGNRDFDDWVHPGYYDFERALKLSSNAYFITNGIHTGVERIVALGERLHLGERIGLQTYQEVSGSFPSLRRVRSSDWYNGNTALMCIGQDPITVTPMQMTVLAAAIANGGKVLRPRLVDRFQTQDPASTEPPLVFPRGYVRNTLGVRPQNLHLLRKAMRADVEDPDGTGRYAAVPGMQVCGKTGTAQIKDTRGHLKEHITWFLSFAPYDNPQYAVVVMLEGGGSGIATAPLAKPIYETLRDLDRSPGPMARTP